MKKTQKLFLYSLSSLTVMASSLASAQEMATAPTLEGGLTASIGTFYAAPVGGNQEYANILTATDNFNTYIDQEIIEAQADYGFGIEAALGYVFEDTANSVELAFRTLDSDGTGSVEDRVNGVYTPITGGLYGAAESNVEYNFNAVDLMFNQFLDIGTHVQVRLAAGASYMDVEKNQKSIYSDRDFVEPSNINDTVTDQSKFSGFGPRVGIDGRYDFGQGFGIVGGGSLAYYVGDLDLENNTVFDTDAVDFDTYTINTSEELDNHGVTNLRANVGIDYVYFFDNNERSTIGLELGYLVDYYADAVGNFTGTQSEDDCDIQPTCYPSGTAFSSYSYSGPYVNLKGAF